MKIFDPEFWAEEWEKAIKKEEQRSDQEKIKIWNKRAENFDKNVSSPSGKERIKETISFLDNYGVLEGETKTILDIGCGPGHYALEFARRGHIVYALDPAEKMIEKLEEKLYLEDKEVAENIIPLQEDWLKLDVKECGYEGKFDLVFASMSPGVNNVRNLKKSICCSKKYFFMSRFSGKRFRDSVFHVLKKHVHLDEYSHLDISYPFNWLYFSGYKPVLHFDSWSRIDEQPTDKARKEIEQMAGMLVEVDDKVLEDIDNYIEVHEENGCLTEEKGAISGLLLFDVEGKCLELKSKEN